MTNRSSVAQLRKLSAWAWVGGVLLFAGLGFAVLMLPPVVVAAALAAGLVVLLWLLFPEAVILGLLLLRSSVDGFMELFTLFAGSPLSMNLAGAVNSLAVGLGAITLLRRLVRRQPLLVTGPGKAFALFLLVCLLSLPGSVDVISGVKEWARLASGLAIFLMVADVVHDERGARRFIVVIMASSLLPLALALFQWLTGGGYFFLGFVGTEFAYRPQGTFGHPAALGSYLILLLTLAIGLYFSEARRGIRAILLGWASVATSCLVLTMARTQWLGMMVATLVIGLLKRRRLAILSILLAALLLTTMPLLRERLMASESVSWRLELWQVSADLAWPLTLLGRGLGTSPWYINQVLPKIDTPPHNDYLKVGIELGALGLLTYAAWFLLFARHAWLAYRRAPDPAIAWRALGLLASVVAVAVMSVTDNMSGHTAVQWYLWAVTALVPIAGRWPETPA